MWSMLSGAYPLKAHLCPTDEELMWFVAVSDPHMGMNLLGGQADTENLNWATSELVDVVGPRFMVNAGDLVDGTGGGLIPLGQFDEEWQTYRAIVDSNGMTPEYYHDIPGNHDAYGDPGLTHYLQQSVSGQAFGELHHAWTLQEAGGNFLFVGLSTADIEGEYWPADGGGLTEVEEKFFKDTLKANPDADILVVFGHHPLSGAYFKQGLEEMFDLLASNNASAYIYGHTHDHSMSWKAGALNFNLASLGKSDDMQVGLFAFDGLGLSAKAFTVADWPQVLITAPLDVELGGDHKHAYLVDGALTEAPVRALAFAPGGMESVTALLDDSVPIAMTEVAPHVFQGQFDASVLDEYPHTLTVVGAASGAADEDSIVFYVKPAPPQTEEPVSPDVATEPGAEVSDFEIVEQGDLAADSVGDGWDDAIAGDGGASPGDGSPSPDISSEYRWLDTSADTSCPDSGASERWCDPYADGGWEGRGPAGDGALIEARGDGEHKPTPIGYIPADKSSGCGVSEGAGSRAAAVLAVLYLLAIQALRAGRRTRGGLSKTS